MNKILSVITVVKDDYSGLIETAKSVSLIVPSELVEYIIWINESSFEIIHNIDLVKKLASKVIVGTDYGIFDAMNKALNYAAGDYVLFLNAKDLVIQGFNIEKMLRPCLLKVQYIDYFGRLRKVVRNHKIDFGIPYCHQGMILPRKGYLFDENLKYGADYLALINMNLNWPLPISDSGLIHYDTTGVSTVNRWESDKWTASIIKRKFGIFYSLRYLFYCLIKLSIKRLYDVKIILTKKLNIFYVHR
uniref:Putative glycosyl transferase n=1 Tax=Chlorobium chlorochromatii (strain CaD3) TaxID=340177 RepID=Q3ASS7_CHLCH